MTKKRKKETKKVATIDEMAILKRDLTHTAIWTGIAVVVVGILAFIQSQFSILS